MPVPTIKLPADVLRDILWDEKDGEILEDKQIGNSRWSINHSLVFSYKGKTYRTSYSVGATEYQDEMPWHDDLEVECVEVKQVPKTIMVWDKV
jgi:hypothetical protein